jgi:hypothetical protein
MTRPTRSPWTASLVATALLVAAPLTALAQEPTDDASTSAPVLSGGMCILQPEEVTELLGLTGEVTAVAEYEGCTYESEDGYLELDWASYYDLEHEPDAVGEEVTVGGHPAWFDGSTSTLYVDTGYRTYGVYLTLDGVGAVLERILPIAETVIPLYVARDEASPAYALAELFPADLGGEPVTIDFRMSGPEWVEMMPDEQRAMVEEMLAAQGATTSELGIATGGTESGAQLSAVRIVGAAATDFATPLVTIAAGNPELSIEPATVGGKDVLVASVPSEESSITIYPSADIAWLMLMDEASVEEALAELP